MEMVWIIAIFPSGEYPFPVSPICFPFLSQYFLDTIDDFLLRFLVSSATCSDKMIHRPSSSPSPHRYNPHACRYFEHFHRVMLLVDNFVHLK